MSEPQKKILVVSSNDDWRAAFKKKAFEMYPEFEVKSEGIRTYVMGSLARNTFNAIVIEGSMSARDLTIILRGITTVNDYQNIYVFFAPSDFELFKDALKDSPVEKILLINMPTSLEQILARVGQFLLPDFVNKYRPKENQSLFSQYKIDLKFMSNFIQATTEVMKQMARTDRIIPGKPDQLLDADKNPLHIALRGKLEINSKYFNGSYLLSFPEDVYKAMYKLMIGENITVIAEDNQDLVLELMNIIYGKVKVILNDQGYELEMKIPSFQFKPIVSREAVFVIPMKTEFGTFYLKIVPRYFSE